MIEKFWGTVLESVGGNRCTVRFDNNSIKECSLTTLRMERANAGLLISELITTESDPTNIGSNPTPLEGDCTTAKTEGDSTTADAKGYSTNAKGNSINVEGDSTNSKGNSTDSPTNYGEAYDSMSLFFYINFYIYSNFASIV